MNGQQLIAMLLVATAAAYLLRNLVVSGRAFFANKSGGCSSGCGKCGFAQKGDASKKAHTPAGQPNLIALSDIRTLPGKRKSN